MCACMCVPEKEGLEGGEDLSRFRTCYREAACSLTLQRRGRGLPNRNDVHTWTRGELEIHGNLCGPFFF